jgi:cytochrome c553
MAFFFGALMMLNVGIVSGAESGFIPWRNAELCFEETVNAANGADPKTLSTIYCTRALRDKPLGKPLGSEDKSAFLYNRGIIQKARGDLIAARASFETAVRLSKTVDKRNLALAEVARELGDHSAALEQYDLVAKSAFAAASTAIQVALLARREEIEAGGTMVASFEKAQACTSCHGANGVSDSPERPTLAGQQEDYLEHALRQYKNGQRQSAVMAAQASAIADEDIPMIARYFSSLKAPNTMRVD